MSIHSTALIMVVIRIYRVHTNLLFSVSLIIALLFLRVVPFNYQPSFLFFYCPFLNCSYLTLAFIGHFGLNK